MSAVGYYSIETLKFIKKWYLSLPLSSAVTVLTCVTLSIVNVARGSPDVGLCPNLILSSPLSNIYHLLTVPFLHSSIVTLLLNLLFFPPLNKMLETQRGTLHSMNFVVIVGIVTGLLYVLVVIPFWAVGIKVDWCIGGLNGLMYALMTVEANQKVGVFKTRRIFGVPLPGAIYPWILLVLSKLFFTASPFFYNLAGILGGILYHIGALKFFFIPDQALVYIETSRALRWLETWEAFVPTPSSVSLPTTDDIGVEPRSSLVGRLRGVFSGGSGRYTGL
ncbi:uncharacterized protein SPPG_02134 [Spizellomyces punctatus DAOM BR117]|uniref:rhomboid protease n=1 Tax=Spizellomyces punctatus (strain DAOM BR117) TaxID=645134 RepID=A0A0L0HQK4_SPIPD|nr:uncharacterized protein SPPG_02134 [Spizellomyces punctatus DAOM BR117]KND03069.1 hypothetical protein SPPG_02134 [Spizellomyces punctatus DAOM BR117]|eukprot:XP_016611108.1 hypothetical protein SPPG_02134 [Spizellomyces punctatus DAOM BR117]